MRPRRRYLLTDPVGLGATGSVWRAWDRRDARWVAAKVLSGPDAGPDAGPDVGLVRLVREEDLRVRHRHVVQPTGSVELGGRPLVTMDLVRGGSLAGLLERHGPLPESYVRVLLEQLLEALVVVHATGLVHRDVKPGNLLLEPTGTGRPWLRLGDFGAAAVLADAARPPGVVGTDGYLAPEQAAGAPPDPRQDLYAAGVTAAAALGSSPAALDGGFGDLVRALAAHDPDRRPAGAAQALVRLRTLGVPAGTPWRHHPRPPDVADVLGAPPAGAARAVGGPVLALATVVAFGAGLAGGLAGGLGAWVLAR